MKILSDILSATIVFAVPLLLVALGGMFSERSGIVNIALEGIMVVGALFSCLALRSLDASGFGPAHPQLGMLIAILVAAFTGALFSLLLAFASVHLQADQTIGGTALNMLAPALAITVTWAIQGQGQTTILIPYLIAITVVAYLGYAFLSTDTGFINNSILAPLGIDAVSFYSNSSYWPAILIFIYLWKNFGYNTILYYATLIGIDDSYYEAAVIDGASTWQQIRHITLPCLKTTIITLTIMAIGRMFYSDFGLFYQVPMSNGLLFDATQTIDTYVFRALIQSNDVGRSSAAGFLQSVLGFVLVLGANLVVRKVDKDSALF